MPYYKGPAGFERVMNLFVNFVITVAFVTYLLSMAQAANPAAPIMTPVNYVASFIPGYAVACFLSTYVPVTNWANKAASKVRGSAGAAVVRALVYDVVLVTLLSAILCWVNNINVLGWEGTLAAWLGLYPIALVAVFVIVLVVLPVGMALASKVSGFDPRKMPGPGESTAF